MNKSTWVYIFAPFVLLVVVLIPIILFGNKCPPQTEEKKEEKVQKKKLSGKQRARIIASILMILGVISLIADIIKGKYSNPYGCMMELSFRIVASYCLVMYVGYPIVRGLQEGTKSQKKSKNNK